MHERSTSPTSLRDPERVAALHRTGLLDAPPESSLTSLSELAARVLGVPIVLTSLVDVDRQYFAGHSGLPQDVAEAQQTPLSHSFCQYVVLDDDELVITDAREVERLRDNGAIADLGVVAYAGIPMRSPDGEVLGSFCAIDTSPREWTDEQLQSLRDIAAAASTEIQMRAMLTARDEAIDQQLEDRRRLETERARLVLLARVGALTSAIEFPSEIVRKVIAELVPELCDWCLIELSPDELEPAGIATVQAKDAQLAAGATELRTLARALDGWNSPTLDAFAKGEPWFLPNVDLTQLAPGGDTTLVPPRLAELVEEVGLHVISAVPLTAREKVIGAISFVRSDVREGFDDSELALHLEIGRRVALAVDAARLREQLERRARASRALEAIADGVALIDAEGVIQLWNPAAERMTAIRESFALGSHLHDVLPELIDVATNEMVGEGAGRLVTVHVPETEDRVLAVTSVRVEGMAALAMRDVSAEQALERTREDIIATVSHQLRTPIASILAGAITLQRDDIEIPEAIQTQVLDTIVQQAHRLTDLCNDVLLASQLSEGMYQVLDDSVALAPLIHELVDAARLRSPELHEVHAEVAADLPDVSGDATAIRQLLGNLLDNAIKYSPDGGRVVISATSSKLDDDCTVDIDIVDPGIGIPSSEFERVFERFHRLDPQMTYSVGGSGLGLFVVRELAQLMGASVAASTPASGTGTRMRVRIPCAD